ncbi:hypothetical protein B0H13DRAFT_2284325 [Mycena leptocephala]|nr:hypothetical protein B0H13DRAFT_2284325 [Mycena leptocephala]
MSREKTRQPKPEQYRLTSTSVALAGVSSGFAEKGQTARRNPRSAAIGLQARVRAQRHARAVVLHLMRAAVAGGFNRGRGSVGKRARPATGWGPKSRAKQSKAEQSRAKQSKAEQSRAKQKGGVVGMWTEEWCVWRANVKKRSRGTSAEETQAAMEGKYGGRAQKNRGERRGRIDDGGRCAGGTKAGGSWSSRKVRAGARDGRTLELRRAPEMEEGRCPHEEASAMRVRHQHANEDGYRLRMDKRQMVLSVRMSTPEAGRLQRLMPSRPAYKRISRACDSACGRRSVAEGRKGSKRKRAAAAAATENRCAGVGRRASVVKGPRERKIVLLRMGFWDMKMNGPWNRAEGEEALLEQPLDEELALAAIEGVQSLPQR